jgi:hypothetical protein
MTYRLWPLGSAIVLAPLALLILVSSNAVIASSSLAASAPTNDDAEQNATRVVFNPSSLDFQTITSGSETLTTTLTNNGRRPLTIYRIWIGGPPPRLFSLAARTCPASLGAGQSCSITVTFTAVGAGYWTSFVSVSDNAAGSPQTVPLAGRAY